MAVALPHVVDDFHVVDGHAPVPIGGAADLHVAVARRFEDLHEQGELAVRRIFDGQFAVVVDGTDGFVGAEEGVRNIRKFQEFCGLSGFNLPLGAERRPFGRNGIADVFDGLDVGEFRLRLFDAIFQKFFVSGDFRMFTDGFQLAQEETMRVVVEAGRAIDDALADAASVQSDAATEIADVRHAVDSQQSGGEFLRGERRDGGVERSVCRDGRDLPVVGHGDFQIVQFELRLRDGDGNGRSEILLFGNNDIIGCYVFRIACPFQFDGFRMVALRFHLLALFRVREIGDAFIMRHVDVLFLDRMEQPHDGAFLWSRNGHFFFVFFLGGFREGGHFRAVRIEEVDGRLLVWQGENGRAEGEQQQGEKMFGFHGDWLDWSSGGCLLLIVKANNNILIWDSILSRGERRRFAKAVEGG